MCTYLSQGTGVIATDCRANIGNKNNQKNPPSITKINPFRYKYLLQEANSSLKFIICKSKTSHVFIPAQPLLGGSDRGGDRTGQEGVTIRWALVEEQELRARRGPEWEGAERSEAPTFKSINDIHAGFGVSANPSLWVCPRVCLTLWTGNYSCSWPIGSRCCLSSWVTPEQQVQLLTASSPAQTAPTSPWQTLLPCPCLSVWFLRF